MSSKLKGRMKKSEDVENVDDDMLSGNSSRGEEVDDVPLQNSAIATKIDRRRGPKRRPTSHVKINQEMEDNYCVRTPAGDVKDTTFNINVVKPVGPSLEDRLRVLSMKYRGEEFRNNSWKASERRSSKPDTSTALPPTTTSDSPSQIPPKGAK